ncbi:MAG: ABC transporter ATP-binding protein [Pseudomonadota bacterium]
MISIFKIFFGAKRTRPVLVLLSLVIAGFFEFLSIGALLPLIAQIGGTDTASDSELSRITEQIFTFFSIPTDLVSIVLVIVSTMVVKGVIAFAALGYVSYAIADAVSALRAQLVRHFLEAKWSYYADQRVGRIANALSNDATRAGTAYQRAARFVAYFVQAIVYISAAILISGQLALVGVTVGAALLVATAWIVRISRKAGYKQTDSTSELTTLIADTMNNIKPLKAMDRQTLFLELFASNIQVLRTALIRQGLATYGRHYAHYILMSLFLGASIFIAVETLKIPLSELVVSGVVFFQVTSIVSKLQGTLQDAAQLESAFWRVDELLNATKASKEVNEGKRPGQLAHEIDLQNVSFSHGSSLIVHNVNLQIPANKITVLQGPSGSGKTTLIDLIIGLHRPDKGRVAIDGVPLGEIDLKDWRQKIGYVPQELNLFHTSIRKNITLGDETVSDREILEALTLAGGAEFVLALPEGLDTVAGELGTKLSGGQRQRIALARALIKRPLLVILDEVTSALDPETEAEIVSKIRELSGEFTIIAVTHRPAWIEAADKLYKISEGAAHEVPPQVTGDLKAG